MGKFIRDTNTTGNGTYIKKESATDEMRRAVLKNVTIPIYFYRIIVVVLYMMRTHHLLGTMRTQKVFIVSVVELVVTL